MYDAKDARTTWGKNIQQWALESGQRYDDGFIQSVTQDKINKGNADVFGNYLKRRWWFSWQKVY